jgi:integrase
VLRKLKADRGPKLFAPAEILQMLDVADQPLKAMIVLAVNAGFGNADCARLPIGAVDLDCGWVTFPRPKTGILRRCPLWPETVETLQGWLARRPEAKDKARTGLVFLTARGAPWGSETSTDRIGYRFKALLDRLGLYRPGYGFYTLRHVFATVGDGARDPVAMRSLMGHAAPASDMTNIYRESIDDSRLVAVVEHVRRWLFGQPARETVVAEPAAIGFDPRPTLLAGLLSDLRNEEETE